MNENEECATIFKEVDDVLLDFRKTKDEKVQDIDHKVVISATNKVLNDSPSHVSKMYERYQKKWINYMKENNIKDVSNQDEIDKALLGFFFTNKSRLRTFHPLRHLFMHQLMVHNEPWLEAELLPKGKSLSEANNIYICCHQVKSSNSGGG